MVSQAFSEMGHQVNYWISDIDHRSKQKRNATNFFIENINVQVIKSNVYASHISLKRIQFEVNFIKQFIVEANLVQQKPDLILIGEPSLFISVSFVKFAQANNIPFIIDMIDLWPDLFKITLPQWLRRFEKIIFAPFYIKRAWFIKKAIGIISVSKAYLEVAKKINTSGNFKYLYWGVDLSSFQNVEKIDFGFQKTKNQFWIIYAGTLGNNYDTKSLIELGKLIEYSKIDYKLFIAGDGNLKELVVQTIKSLNLKKTIYLGRVSPEELVGFYQPIQKIQLFQCLSKHLIILQPVYLF
jgi:glycosyltransferase involved in cell wall biosynthesis